jgi:uroporphyrinogen decarboxylase
VQYGDISSYTVIEPVLAEAEDPDDVERIKWPGRDFVDIEASVNAAKEARETGLAVYGGAWASLFTNSRSIMGEENLLISLISNPELVTRLIERLTDFYIETNEVYFQACSRYIDVFYFGSDFGTQNSMFISKEMFNRFFKSSFKRLVEHAKGFGLKVMYHTCGAVTSIINDLIDCGIDILDPVQVSAAGMEPGLLAKDFKGRIVFHGGVSTQTTLPFGTPEEVQEEVARLINTLGPTGLIAAPDQDMIGDIPLENIEMMFRTISKTAKSDRSL